MNEGRMALYANLVYQLLNCPDGEQMAILREHSDLIDGNLVVFMRVIAQQLRENGQGDEAMALESSAGSLAAVLARQENRNVEEQDCLGFLWELLQAEKEVNSHPRVVFPILAKHQDKLNLQLIPILQELIRKLTDSSSRDKAPFLGALENFCINLRNFPLGDHADNLELVIAVYGLILQNYLEGTRQWGRVHHNFANAYHARLRGERGENLEAAIYHYTLALTVRTREDFPEQWAATQNNLGNAFKEVHREQEAITCYHNTLMFWTPETNPMGCLTVTNNLGKLQSDLGNWQAASNAYETATQALDLLGSWENNEEYRQEILKNGISVYENLAQCYINLGQLNKALETSERSRHFVDSIASNDADKGEDIY